MFTENVITSVCKRKQASVGQRTIIAVDTPGLFNPSKDEENLMNEIRKGVCMSAPGPHVFLLVIRLDMRLAEDEKNIVTLIQNNFGNDAVNYTFVLFTHSDHLNGESVEENIRRSPDLQLLIDQHEGRFHSFNNRNRHNRDQVTALVEKMEQMVWHNRGQYYSIEYFSMPQEVVDMEAVEMLRSMGIIFGIGITVAVMILKQLK